MSDESKLGSIEERNGKFRVRLPRALDPERTSRTFESRELAEKFLRGASAVLQDDAPHGHDTLASYVPEWLDRRELGGVRAVARERSVWRCHIANTKLARMPLASIEKSDVRAWLDALAKKPAEPKVTGSTPVLRAEANLRGNEDPPNVTDDDLGTDAVPKNAALKMLAIAVLTEIADVGEVGVPLLTAFDVAARRVDPTYPAQPSMGERLIVAARSTRR